MSPRRLFRQPASCSADARPERTLVLGVCGATLALGCAVPAETDAGLGETRGTHAFVTITREADRADGHTSALSAFLRIGEGQKLGEVSPLAPSEPPLPAHPGCSLRSGSGEASSSESLSVDSSAQVPELLVADSVVLRVGETAQELAPFAFPRLGDQMGGAVYASRRLRSFGPRGSALFELKVEGLGEPSGDSPGTFEFSFEVPGALEDVAVAGTPVETLEALPGFGPLDFTWSPGESRTTEAPDWVLVELAAATQSVSCAYPRSDGTATLGDGLLRELRLGRGGLVTLTVRTVGTRPAQRVVGFAGVLVRFDQSSTRHLEWGPPSPG